jgi:hypothetical protein
MSFTDVWNSAYENIPADNNNISLGAGDIRDLKENIRERANIDHSWGDANDSGKHLQSTYQAALATPGTPAGSDGCVWAQQVSGNTELFYRDSNGDVIQLTKLGNVNVTAFPSGTQMVFNNASPPPGWTQNVGFNDQMLRTTNGAAGGTGGGWTITGTAVATSVTTNTSVAAPNVGGTISTSVSDGGSSVNGTVANHTLAVTEIPAHTHGLVDLPGTTTISATNSGPQQVNIAGTHSSTTDNGTGGGGAHNHGWSGSLSLVLNASSTPSLTASAPLASSASSASSSFSNDGSWRPTYVNIMMASKN